MHEVEGCNWWATLCACASVVSVTGCYAVWVFFLCLNCIIGFLCFLFIQLQIEAFWVCIIDFWNHFCMAAHSHLCIDLWLGSICHSAIRAAVTLCLYHRCRFGVVIWSGISQRGRRPAWNFFFYNQVEERQRYDITVNIYFLVTQNSTEKSVQLWHFLFSIHAFNLWGFGCCNSQSARADMAVYQFSNINHMNVVRHTGQRERWKKEM